MCSIGEYFFTSLQVIKENGNIWFSSREINGLFCIDIEKKNVKYVTSFRAEQDSRYLHGKNILYKNRLYFVPYGANSIGIYDLDNKQISSIDLDMLSKKEYYLTSISYGDYIYILPSLGENIIKLNINTYNVDYINSWKDKFKIVDISRGIFREACVVDNILYAPLMCTRGQIMKMELDSGNITCIQLNKEIYIKGICFTGRDFYFLSDNHLVRWEKELNTYKYIALNYNEEMNFSSCIYQDGTIYIFTNNTIGKALDDIIIAYDIETEKISEIIRVHLEVEGNISHKLNLASMFAVDLESDKNRIWAYYSGNGYLYEINTLDKEITKHCIKKYKFKQLYEDMMKNRKYKMEFERELTTEHLKLFLDKI